MFKDRQLWTTALLSLPGLDRVQRIHLRFEGILVSIVTVQMAGDIVSGMTQILLTRGGPQSELKVVLEDCGSHACGAKLAGSVVGLVAEAALD